MKRKKNRSSFALICGNRQAGSVPNTSPNLKHVALCPRLLYVVRRGVGAGNDRDGLKTMLRRSRATRHCHVPNRYKGFLTKPSWRLGQLRGVAFPKNLEGAAKIRYKILYTQATAPAIYTNLTQQYSSVDHCSAVTPQDLTVSSRTFS